ERLFAVGGDDEAADVVEHLLALALAAVPARDFLPIVAAAVVERDALEREQYVRFPRCELHVVPRRQRQRHHALRDVLEVDAHRLRCLRRIVLLLVAAAATFVAGAAALCVVVFRRCALVVVVGGAAGAFRFLFVGPRCERRLPILLQHDRVDRRRRRPTERR